MKILYPLLRSLPEEMHGESIRREEPCRLCGQLDAELISKVDYWDIKRCSIVKCTNCGLAQFDPMLDNEEAELGCYAYYLDEIRNVPEKDQLKSVFRSFRRGADFAYSLRQRHIVPIRILELGPGSGYFMRGVQHVFPNAQIVVMDINSAVLDSNHRRHGYTTLQATPEDEKPELRDQFDLVIARDVLEHVADIGKTLKNIYRYLKKDGYLHFLVPNGHEDLWRFYLRYTASGSTSEILINHVNYFDGAGLQRHLEKMGFAKLDYYAYKIKNALKGNGRSIEPAFQAEVSTQKSAQGYVKAYAKEVMEKPETEHDVLNTWYLKKQHHRVTRWIFRLKQMELIQVPPSFRVGVEFHGLFRKVQ